MFTTLPRSKERVRGLGAVELAAAIAISGSLLAISVPIFSREIRASRFVEPVEGLRKISTAAVAHAQHAGAFPDSAPLTPESVPRGRLVEDPAGTWDHPTWQALSFRGPFDEAPHAFSFQFDTARVGSANTFVVTAHGDLNGDGAFSTFEVRGSAPVIEPRSATIQPGMYVSAEVE